jgi:hypothetical protein
MHHSVTGIELHLQPVGKDRLAMRHISDNKGHIMAGGGERPTKIRPQSTHANKDKTHYSAPTNCATDILSQPLSGSKR